MRTIAGTTAVAAVAGLLTASAAVADAPLDEDTQAVLTAVKDVCLPVLKGAKIDGVAKPAGLRNGRDGWTLPIKGKRHVAVDPPSGSNPHVCTGTVIHEVAAGPSIITAVGAWAGAQSPPLQAVKVQEKVTGPVYAHVTSSWVGKLDGSDAALVYSEDRTLDGKPVAGTLDQATFSLALTPTS